MKLQVASLVSMLQAIDMHDTKLVKGDVISSTYLYDSYLLI